MLLVLIYITFTTLDIIQSLRMQHKMARLGISAKRFIKGKGTPKPGNIEGETAIDRNKSFNRVHPGSKPPQETNNIPCQASQVRLF
jgi:hypothetical protein